MLGVNQWQSGSVTVYINLARPKPSKQDIHEMCIALGFEESYAERAFKVYSHYPDIEKDYEGSSPMEVITEIIVRLQNKDKSKQRRKSKNAAVAQQSTDHRDARNQIDIKRRDIVMYQGQQVEVMRVKKNKVEISYPISQNRLQRSRKTVGIMELQRLNDQSSIDRKQSQKQQRPQAGNTLAPKPDQFSFTHCPPFKKGDIVLYQGQQAQVMRVMDNMVDISYPASQYIMNRRRKTVDPMELQSHVPPFRAHMTLQEASKLRVHDKIDHRDQVTRFVPAVVSEKQGTNLKIHYVGWSRKWDTWSDYSREIHRFAVAGSISKRIAHRFQHLKKGDYVDINPKTRHPGWRCGEIRQLDQKSGQVQVVYDYELMNNKNPLYWAHLDDESEIAEFTSKSGTINATQLDILQNEGRGDGRNQGRSKIAMGAAPTREMETFQKIRAKRYPRAPNEQITNKYQIGDWLEVQDTQTLHWIKATVIDRESNWIVLHFDAWPSKYDQKIHVVEHKKKLRDLGSGLQEIQNAVESPFSIFLTEHDFNSVLEMYNVSPPLDSGDLRSIFKPLMKKTRNKLILDPFWNPQSETSLSCKKWIGSLKEKIASGQFPAKIALNTFNEIIVALIPSNLGHIVKTQKPQSTIDHNKQQQHHRRHQDQQDKSNDVPSQNVLSKHQQHPNSNDNQHNSDQSKTSQREQILNALNSKHQQLQSLFLSLDETAITKLDGDATIAQIHQSVEDIIQSTRASTAENNDSVRVDRLSNSRKRSRSEFENSDNSESIRERQSESEPRKSRRKPRKMDNSSESSKEFDLTRYISPAPIHFKIQSVQDDDVQSNSDRQCGRFRIKLKIQKHPIKEALIQIGARNFTVNDMLDTLAEVQSKSDNAVITGRGETARKLLIEELMMIPGVHRVRGSGNEGDIELSAAKFYDQHLATLHDSCDSLYSALQKVKGFDVLQRERHSKSEV